jgi:CRP-like cAMP-binding protein
MNDPKLQRQNFLRQVPLFGGVDLQVCGELVHTLETVELGQGEALYEAGENAGSLYILYSGKVVLEQGGLQLNELGAGAHLGDMEFFDMAPRSFTVRAKEPCELWCLPFDAFDKLRRKNLKDFTLIAMNAARQMSRQLRQSDSKLIDHHKQSSGAAARVG